MNRPIFIKLRMRDLNHDKYINIHDIIYFYERDIESHRVGTAIRLKGYKGLIEVQETLEELRIKLIRHHIIVEGTRND